MSAMYEPEWATEWHCVAVDMGVWSECREWCFKNLDTLKTWNWSRFVNLPDDPYGYVDMTTMGFYFKNKEDAVAFTLSNKIKDNENI